MSAFAGIKFNFRAKREFLRERVGGEIHVLNGILKCNLLVRPW